ncbi:MAG: phosphate regulon sensor histidine kinase PhoR, partial [Lysobacterales bacterium]
MPARSWKFHAGRLLVASAIIVGVAWWSGYAAIVLGLALTGFLGWHLYNLMRLNRWLKDPSPEIPDSHGIWSDIFDALDDREKQNRRQRERFQAMLGDFRDLTNAFPDATLVIDDSDNLTWFNDAATSMLKLKNPADLGKPVTNLLRSSDFANWLAVQSEVRSPLEITSPGRDDVWLSATAVRFGESQRLIILRDITEVHNVEQIRRDFVANISHELRTPLTVLQGYLELLQTHSADDVSEAVSRMLAQTAQMQTLLDDLLELSRLQSDEIHGKEENVDVPAILMQLKEQAEELSRGQHELRFDVASGLHLTGVTADLESAFRNLISNAVKYTPPGGTISVTWRDTEKGPRLSVRDTGIGIPRRDIPRITERFYRVGSDRARQTGGTGLGLAIVKHVLN